MASISIVYLKKCGTFQILLQISSLPTQLLEKIIDVCTIHSGNQLITTAKDIDGMYCLDTKVVRDVSQNISIEFVLQADIQLWHRRLLHASLQ